MLLFSAASVLGTVVTHGVFGRHEAKLMLPRLLRDHHDKQSGPIVPLRPIQIAMKTSSILDTNTAFAVVQDDGVSQNYFFCTSNTTEKKEHRVHTCIMRQDQGLDAYKYLNKSLMRLHEWHSNTFPDYTLDIDQGKGGDFGM